MRLAGLANGVLAKILQKWHFSTIMKKNNFINNNQTDKNCQYPTGEGKQCASRRLRVLVACEESQTTCKAFRTLGHEAYSCDIQDCSGGYPEWHIKGDALQIINQDWDLIIAHPPCTFMSKAGARWMYPTAGNLSEERFKLSQEAKAFFMEFYNCKCKHVAIENPVPLKVVGLPPHTQSIQPYEFGEPYSKQTLLWLKGLPKLNPTKIVAEHKPWMPSNTGGFARGMGGSRGVAHDPKTASKTFAGIAQAFAEQWSEYLLSLPTQTHFLAF